MTMAEHRDPLDGAHFLFIAAALVIIIYGINQAQSVVSLFLVSLFLALLGTPPVLWLERKRVPTFLSVVIVMGGMVTFLLAVGGVVGSSLSTFSDTLPMYQSRLHEQVLALQALLATKNIDVTEKTLLEYLNPGTVMSLVAGLFSGLGSALSHIILILLTVTFILLEISSFPIKIRSVLGEPKRVFPEFTKFDYQNDHQPDRGGPHRDLVIHSRSRFSHSVGFRGVFAQLRTERGANIRRHSCGASCAPSTRCRPRGARRRRVSCYWFYTR